MPVGCSTGCRASRGLVVGDNEPYSGRHPANYTIDHHAKAAGLPHVCIEVRQDLLDSPAGVERWVRLLARVGRADCWRTRAIAAHEVAAWRQPQPPLTLGIEEEFLLVDRETRAVASEPPPELFAALHDRTDGRAFPEFLRSQVEVATPICRTVAEARSVARRAAPHPDRGIRAPRPRADRGGHASVLALVASRSAPTRSATSRCSRKCRASRAA